MYSPYVFNFPSLVYCENIASIFLNKAIRKILVELGWHMLNELKISQFGTWWSHDLGYCKEHSKQTTQAHFDHFLLEYLKYP